MLLLSVRKNRKSLRGCGVKKMAKKITNPPHPPFQYGHISDRALMQEGFEQLENSVNKSVREISFANYARLAPVLGRDDTWVAAYPGWVSWVRSNKANSGSPVGT